MWKWITDNPMLSCPIIGWCSAQIIKTIINFAMNKKFNPERLIGSGGMPSSHAATVSGLAAATAIVRGINSFEFAISFVLAMIVMYDAMNVRMETGKQAMILNLFLRSEETKKKLAEVGKEKWAEIILKEYVGHTPIQVLAGMCLGILIAVIICLR